MRGNIGFVCCVCRENQSEVPNIQTNILDRSNVSAALADDRELVVDEQLETDTFPFHEEITLPPEDGQYYQFQEEHLQKISLEDETHIFNKKGLHFVHLNCNSLLSKIDEIREFVLQSKPHVIGVSETKLD